MEVKYSPKAEGFSGHVVLVAPTYEQRSKYMMESGLEFDENGELKKDIKAIGTIAKIISFSASHYKEVALTYEDGTIFKSYEEMTVDPVADRVLQEIAMLILNGIRPSKN